MAEYYIAPKSSFDATADAIREKTGSQATIEWTQDGFADAVEAIPTGGGGISVDDLATNTQPSGAITLSNSITEIKEYAFAGKPITSIYGPSVTKIGMNSLQDTNVTSITDADFPVLGVTTQYNILLRISSLTAIKLSGSKITIASGTGALRDNKALVSAEFPNASKNVGASTLGMGMSAFNSCTNLEMVDIGNCNSIGNLAFNNCSKLAVIIMRKPDACVTLVNTGVFNGSPFRNGGAGGTIYIPKALYDHLGDGTSLDYKAATNWSTVDGYGTITWAQIEGSEYENYYADGTPIT